MPYKNPADLKACRERHRAKTIAYHRKRYREKRAEIRAASRAYYYKNRVRLAAEARKARAADPDKFRLRAQEHRMKNPEKVMWRSAKARAKQQGILFTISVDHVHIPLACPVLGIKLTKALTRHNTPRSPSLDRIDIKRGYVPGNVCVISWRANRLKSDATAAELDLIAAYIRKQI